MTMLGYPTPADGESIPIRSFMEALQGPGGRQPMPGPAMGEGARTELPIDLNTADMGPDGIAGPAYADWKTGLGIGAPVDGQPTYSMQPMPAGGKVPIGPVTIEPGDGGLWRMDGAAEGLPAQGLLAQLRNRFAPTMAAPPPARNSNGGLVARSLNAGRPNGIGTIASRLAQDPSRSVGVGALMGGGLGRVSGL